MTTELEQDAERKRLVWIKPPSDICEFYANLIHVVWSLDDVRIRFAQIVPHPTTLDPGPSLRGAAEERGAVTLSWRVAKVLRNQLTKLIDNYEQANGEINLNVNLPPDTD